MSVLIIYWALQTTGENTVNKGYGRSCTIAFCYASDSTAPKQNLFVFDSKL